MKEARFGHWNGLALRKDPKIHLHGRHPRRPEGTKVSMLVDTLDMFADLWRIRLNDWRGCMNCRAFHPGRSTML